MKKLMAMVVLVSMYGCVYGECRDPLKIPMIPKRDPQLAHKCSIDPYRPECSVN
ncbi:hypothetical protein SAMN03159304_02770 [Pseudomonas sp. NFACC24-1]|nr:hypothetical protein SAMN03159304_02770 [Pseudomonas sp. NFACC24-1]